jgi:hypothetical protein
MSVQLIDQLIFRFSAITLIEPNQSLYKRAFQMFLIKNWPIFCCAIEHKKLLKISKSIAEMN